MRALINSNFLIKWKKQGDTKFQLVSAGKYHIVVGSEKRAQMHFKRALESKGMKCTIKVKGRLEINFICR